jgi:hypothetical protein
MLDIAVSYNRYKFLGHEFLTWLWHMIDRDQGSFTDDTGTPFYLVIGNRIVCQQIIEENTVETVMIKGDNAGLEEGLLALRKGSLVTELSLSLTYLEQNWEFNLKGENFHLTGFKHPQVEKIEKKEDREGAILEKVFLYEQAVKLVDQVFLTFLKLRLSDTWNQETLGEIKAWITR